MSRFFGTSPTADNASISVNSSRSRVKQTNNLILFHLHNRWKQYNKVLIVFSIFNKISVACISQINSSFEQRNIAIKKKLWIVWWYYRTKLYQTIVRVNTCTCTFLIITDNEIQFCFKSWFSSSSRKIGKMRTTTFSLQSLKNLEMNVRIRYLHFVNTLIW